MISSIRPFGVDEIFCDVGDSLSRDIAFGQEFYAFIIFIIKRESEGKKGDGELIVVTPLGIITLLCVTGQATKD